MPTPIKFIDTEGAKHLWKKINKLIDLKLENTGMTTPVTMQTVLEKIYPVGSLYYTADSTFNPNTALIGKWEKIDSGLFMVTAGTGTDSLGHTRTFNPGNNVSSTYYYRNLTVSHMPAHTHGMTHNHPDISYTGNTPSGGAHTHTVRTKEDFCASGTLKAPTINSDDGTWTSLIKSGGAHTHSISHTHSIANSSKTSTDSKGSGADMTTVNPSYAMYSWKRVE